jgi:hypothetical protein
VTEKQHSTVIGVHSFYSKYIYDQIVPGDHFLFTLRAPMDWEYFTGRLIRLNEAERVVGPSPPDPSLVLKFELVAYLNSHLER